MNKEPDSWITINGQHVPIFEGEGKREAVSRFINKKMSRVAKNKDKYDKIIAFKKRKATNNKIDIEKPRYHADKTGTKFEMDKEDREKTMKKLGLNRGDNASKEFNTNEDETKWKMRDDVREQYEKKLGLRKYRDITEKNENKENYDEEPTPIRKRNTEHNNIDDQRRVRELAIKWEQAKDKDEKQRISQEVNKILEKYKKNDFEAKKQNDNKYIVERKEERNNENKRLGINKYGQGIEDYEKIGNTYIPVRKGENKEDLVKDYKERERNVERIKELQDNDRALQSGMHVGSNDAKIMQEAQRNKGKVVDYNRRAKLMRFTQDNKDLIDKWVEEYDDETHKRVGEKVLRGEGLTAKEYFGFLGSGPRPGSIIGEEFPDGEDAIVANDGNWVRKSRIKEYNKNPKANQDAVYSEKDDLEWQRIEAEEFDKINRFRKRKSSNK